MKPVYENNHFYINVITDNYTGNIADWVKRKFNTPVVFTIYMKTNGYIFPSAKDIVPLTNQFSTMLKETLMLASSVYSPLFSTQIRNSINYLVILIIPVTNLFFSWSTFTQ